MLKELLRFTIKPSIPILRMPSIKEFSKILFICILISIPFAIISKLIENEFGIIRPEYTKASKLIILYGVFGAPIFEEILFRSWLKWTKTNIYFLITTIILMIAISIFLHKFEQICKISILVSLLIMVIYLMKNTKVKPYIVRNFKYFYWSSSVTFGLMHASNFTGNVWYIILFAFVLTSPQIIVGFFLGFVRMNYGLRFSILLHMLYNSSLLLFLLHK